jgi:hypothetical protein
VVAAAVAARAAPAASTKNLLALNKQMPVTDAVNSGGRRKSGASVKTLKKMLKKAGLKVSGKKATLTRRAKKAHLKMAGGANDPPASGTSASSGTSAASGIPASPGTPPPSAAVSSTPPASAAASPARMGGRRSRSRGRSMRGFPRLY